MKPVQWLDRRLTICAYSYCLILTKEEFDDTVKRLKVKRDFAITFIAGQDFARTYLIGTHQAEITTPVALVCLDRDVASRHTGPQIAALLTHESVHIWQAHARDIGAGNDHGDEEEAYAIQAISQALFEEYAERVKS